MVSNVLCDSVPLWQIEVRYTVINNASRILTNIFFPGIEDALSEKGSLHRFACSPVTITTGFPAGHYIRMILTADGSTQEVRLFHSGFDTERMRSIERFTESLEKTVKFRAGLVFKRRFSVNVSNEKGKLLGHSPPSADARYAVIHFVLVNDANTVEFSIYVPLLLLALLSTGILAAEDGDFIESVMNAVFREPFLSFPDLPVILDSFEESELQRLFSHLMQNRLLSIYQLCLIILALPDYAIRVKHSLSTNNVREVAGMMRKLQENRSVKRRDLIVGVYSVEDAVYRLMKKGGDFRYSLYLRELRSQAAAMEACEVLLARDFSQWLSIMDEDGLLYHTLAALPEKTLSVAFTGNRINYESVLRRHLSSRRVNDIFNIGDIPSSFDEQTSSRLSLISEYRSQRVKRRNWGAESFEHVLRGITEPGAFRRLLLETGWFALSTALKNIRPEMVKTVTDLLPRPAGYLIEDVLRNVINPNIIHDELQVNQARALCVRAAISLYEDGLIALEL